MCVDRSEEEEKNGQRTADSGSDSTYNRVSHIRRALRKILYCGKFSGLVLLFFLLTLVFFVFFFIGDCVRLVFNLAFLFSFFLALRIDLRGFSLHSRPSEQCADWPRLAHVLPTIGGASTWTMWAWTVLWLLLLATPWRPAEASILNTLLGVPSECVHQSGVWPCKLSFSCWLQGGKHAKGCGANKWLFSCCVSEAGGGGGAGFEQSPTANLVGSLGALQEYNKKLAAAAHLPKRVMLKRRTENEVFGRPECGLPRDPRNTLQKRIIGGRPAHFGEYPWQAHIRIAEYQCGGVLVSANIIATAAHCIQQARLQDIAVYLGELDTQDLGVIHEPLPVEKHHVVQKIVHPRFKFRLTQPDRYDLALLKLAKPTGFSEHILPICLPQHPINLVGRKGLIAGWGKTEASLGHAGTNMLQVATVPIINSMDCIRWHVSKQINVELYEEMFCAGHVDGHQDACLGDSGGPLIIKDRGRFVLVGITSAGFGCGVDHQPGIYHNIQKTAKWIQDVVMRNT